MALAWQWHLQGQIAVPLPFGNTLPQAPPLANPDFFPAPEPKKKKKYPKRPPRNGVVWSALKTTQRARILKKINLAWTLENFKLSLENFNLAWKLQSWPWKLQSWPWEFSTKTGGLVGGSLEIFNLAWKCHSFQSCLKISIPEGDLEFFQDLGPLGILTTAKRYGKCSDRLALKTLSALPKGPFRTKNSTAPESVVFCYRRSFSLSLPFSCFFLLEKPALLLTLRSVLLLP